MSFKVTTLKGLLPIFCYLLLLIVNKIQSFLYPDCFLTVDKCPNENITFWLYTRETQQNPIKIQEHSINPQLFLPRRQLKVLIHGYTGHKDYSPNTYLRPAFFKASDIFIISVDYGPIVREPCYFHAVMRNYLVTAKCTAKLLDTLISKGIFAFDDIHVIGFSLGAQVAGTIATFLTAGKLSRITGLDPARPLFEVASNSKKLDASDAHFVDVVHTDIFGRGMALPLGHLDFYPNGGSNQPGCSDTKDYDSSGSCNHDRAPLFYAESILTEIGFWGYECSSILEYKTGLCNWSESKHQELMGYYANPNATGKYFFTTNSKKPFARGVYPAALSFEISSSRPLHQVGRLSKFLAPTKLFD